jgi:hypothetical protein
MRLRFRVNCADFWGVKLSKISLHNAFVELIKVKCGWTGPNRQDLDAPWSNVRLQLVLKLKYTEKYLRLELSKISVHSKLMVTLYGG